MTQRDDSSWREAVRSLGLVGYLGFAIAVPIAAGAWLGHLVDLRLGTGGLFAVGGILVGVAAGILTAYKTIMQAVGDDGSTRKNGTTTDGSERTTPRDD